MSADLYLVLSLVESKDYLAAAVMLRADLSGIEWGDDTPPCADLMRDLDLLHAINAIQSARVFGGAEMRAQAIANVEALISGDDSGLRAMEERHADVARVELGI